MMTAFEDMMRRKIVMPAHFMRQSGDKVGELWSHFSDAAQRTQVYTAQDYIDILKSFSHGLTIAIMDISLIL